jgi:DNA-binding MarR family transcriptional regulator
VAERPAVSLGGDSLADDFWAATRRLRERTRAALAPWQITPSHARALRVLRTDGPLRLGDLSDRLRIAPRSVTEVVDALQDRGYVLRQSDPADRRATLVGLTDEGRRTVEEVEAARQAEAERLFSAMTASDREQLRRLLHTLAR